MILYTWDGFLREPLEVPKWSLGPEARSYKMPNITARLGSEKLQNVGVGQGAGGDPSE